MRHGEKMRAFPEHRAHQSVHGECENHQHGHGGAINGGRENTHTLAGVHSTVITTAVCTTI